MEESKITVLDLVDTPLAEQVQNDGTRGISADRVQHFLESQGIVVDSAIGVTVRKDGTIIVGAEVPSEVWQNYTNEPVPEENDKASKIAKLKNFKSKAEGGKLSQNDRDDILLVIVDSMLKAFGQQ